MTRHASMRTTMSEQMEYRKDQQFLNPGMTDILGSTPEVCFPIITHSLTKMINFCFDFSLLSHLKTS